MREGLKELEGLYRVREGPSRVLVDRSTELQGLKVGRTPLVKEGGILAARRASRMLEGT